MAGADPLHVTVEGDAARSRTAVIGPAGGSVETTDARGVRYVLTLPEDAVIGFVGVTVTPLAGIGNYPYEDPPAAGVLLKPEGLLLTAPARLVIEADLGISEESIQPVAWFGGGLDFHRWVMFDEPGIVIPVTHLGGYAVGDSAGGPTGSWAPADLVASAVEAVQAETGSPRLTVEYDAAWERVGEAAVTGVDPGPVAAAVLASVHGVDNDATPGVARHVVFQVGGIEGALADPLDRGPQFIRDVHHAEKVRQLITGEEKTVLTDELLDRIIDELIPEILRLLVERCRSLSGDPIATAMQIISVERQRQLLSGEVRTELMVEQMSECMRYQLHVSSEVTTTRVGETFESGTRVSESIVTVTTPETALIFEGLVEDSPRWRGVVVVELVSGTGEFCGPATADATAEFLAWPNMDPIRERARSGQTVELRVAETLYMQNEMTGTIYRPPSQETSCGGEDLIIEENGLVAEQCYELTWPPVGGNEPFQVPFAGGVVSRSGAVTGVAHMPEADFSFTASYTVRGVRTGPPLGETGEAPNFPPLAACPYAGFAP